MRGKRINMYDGPILTAMLRFGLPVLATGLLQQFFNSADVILAKHLATHGDFFCGNLRTANSLGIDRFSDTAVSYAADAVYLLPNYLGYYLYCGVNFVYLNI